MKEERQRMHALFGAALLLAVVSPAASFYLPGVAPTDYGVGNPMNVKVRWDSSFCLAPNLLPESPSESYV